MHVFGKPQRIAVPLGRGAMTHRYPALLVCAIVIVSCLCLGPAWAQVTFDFSAASNGFFYGYYGQLGKNGFAHASEVVMPGSVLDDAITSEGCGWACEPLLSRNMGSQLSSNGDILSLAKKLSDEYVGC